MGYYQHLKSPGIKDLDCDNCTTAKREAKQARGFTFPTPADNYVEDCPKAFLWGCPVADEDPHERRLYAAIEAYNFFQKSCFWCAGGLVEQPRWYRQLMSYMDGAQAEEQDRKQRVREANMPKPGTDGNGRNQRYF